MTFPRKQKPNPETPRRRAAPVVRPQAFSYHAKRAEQEYNLGRQQPRDQDARRQARLVKYWRQRIGVLLALVVVLACAVNVLRLSYQPRIISLTSGSKSYFLRDTTVYQQAAQKLLASSILNNNKITINAQDIAKQLQKQFPELSDVSVTLPLLSHKPIVYIAPTTPSLLLTTKGGTFVLDNNGKALLPADAVADVAKLHLPTVTDQSSRVIHQGDLALPSQSVSFISTVLAQLAAKGVNVESLSLPPAAFEFDVKPAGVGYVVKFNTHDDSAGQQAGAFLAVRQRLTSQNIVPTAYIDVRVDGRAYYK